MSVSDPVKFERVRARTVLDDVIQILPAYAMTGIQGYAQGGPMGALTSMFAKLGL